MTNATLSSRGPRLTGEVVGVVDLDTADRHRMHELMDRFYLGATWDVFERDLDEKDTAILLRDAETHDVRGFTTMKLLEADVDGETVTALFSGDTIVAPDFWGESRLVHYWGKHVFELFCQSKQRRRRLYWFLISSGHKTYRFLPLFFREFYPHCQYPTPANVQLCLDTLARARYGQAYDAEQGIIRLDHPTPLRSGVADIGERELSDRHVAYFLERNPGHVNGDELACLTEIRDDNLSRAARRLLQSL